MMIAQNTPTNSKDHRPMQLHQGLECGLIALANEGFQKSAIRRFGVSAQEQVPAEPVNDGFDFFHGGAVSKESGPESACLSMIVATERESSRGFSEEMRRPAIGNCPNGTNR